MAVFICSTESPCPSPLGIGAKNAAWLWLNIFPFSLCCVREFPESPAIRGIINCCVLMVLPIPLHICRNRIIRNLMGTNFGIPVSEQNYLSSLVGKVTRRLLSREFSGIPWEWALKNLFLFWWKEYIHHPLAKEPKYMQSTSYNSALTTKSHKPLNTINNCCDSWTCCTSECHLHVTCTVAGLSYVI